MASVDLIELRTALEASWGPQTSYGGVWMSGNPALGQCYPTARVVQRFFPASEIVRGTVRAGSQLEIHFWNELSVDGGVVAIDLTWQQFPPGSVVISRETLDRDRLYDSPPTVARCALLLDRVLARFSACPGDE